MKLQEAIIKSNPGDQIHGKGLKFIMKDNGALYYTTEGESQELACLMKRDFQHDDWVIIPAEPKVYCAEEIAIACLKSNGKDSDPTAFEISLITEGEKNGQLKQWLNHKELREAIERYEDNLGDYDSRNEIIEAYANLKPLNQK